MLNTDMSDTATRHFRIAGWSLAAGLLALPLVAMQFTSEVNWTASDFLFAGIGFAIVGGLFELAARARRNIAYRAGTVLAVSGCFLIVWISMAVGIIGESDDPRNIIYFAIVAMIATGAYVARGSAEGLKRTMRWMAGFMLLVALMHVGPARMAVPIDLFLSALWAIASLLFGKAEQRDRMQVQ
jgi:hypothetical protein